MHMNHPLYQKGCLIFGCGNPLFEDDGVGPAVIAHLEDHYLLPDDVASLDVGTSIRDILFDLVLSDSRPRQIIIVDAADHAGRPPGTISEIDIDEIEPSKIADFSLHQFPTTNMLKELKEETDMDVRVFVVQMSRPPIEVNPGLTPPVKAAVPLMCKRIVEVLMPPARLPQPTSNA